MDDPDQQASIEEVMSGMAEHIAALEAELAEARALISEATHPGFSCCHSNEWIIGWASGTKKYLVHDADCRFYAYLAAHPEPKP